MGQELSPTSLDVLAMSEKAGTDIFGGYDDENELRGAVINKYQSVRPEV